MIIVIFSRPRQVKDVAHQDEVVRVLTNTLETANVISFSLSHLFRVLYKSFVELLVLFIIEIA